MSRRNWWLWLLGSAAGTVLVAAPDDGDRIFSISRTHGPALLDAIGSFLILIAWSVLWVSVWKRRAFLPPSAGIRTTVGLLGFSALVLLVWSIGGDHGAWWVLSVAVLGGLQVVAAVIVSKPKP